MKKILVVNVNWLGDVIFSSPVFRALHDHDPSSEIVCFAVPRVADVLKQIPFVNRMIVYDEKGAHRSLLKKWHLIRKIRREHFDCVFLIHGSKTRAWLMYLSGIPIRVGHGTKRRGFLLTHETTSDITAIHRRDHYLKVIEDFGITVNHKQCALHVSEDALIDVNKILESQGIKKNDSFVVLNTGGNWDLKRWPMKNWAKLADAIYDDRGCCVVCSGGPADKKNVKEIASWCRKARIVNLAGQTNFEQLLALMKRADIVVSADSGPMHAAHSVGASVVCLFGPTHPDITGPRGTGKSVVVRYDTGCNKRPCYYLECSDNICMSSINVYDVLQKINEIQRS